MLYLENRYFVDTMLTIRSPSKRVYAVVRRRTPRARARTRAETAHGERQSEERQLENTGRAGSDKALSRDYSVRARRPNLNLLAEFQYHDRLFTFRQLVWARFHGVYPRLAFAGS